MTVHPSAVDTANEPRAPRVALAAALLDQALQSQRSGTFDEAVRQHPRAARWLVRRLLPVVRGAAGDALPDDSLPLAAAWLLRWAVTQLRPDAEPAFDGIADEAWLQLPGWRPFLAMAAHQGQLAVPDFPRRYRRRAGEAALDNLCGLWDVQPSTVYRVLERARQSMAQLAVEAPPDALRRLSLRRFVAAEAQRLQGVAHGAAREAWHAHQARRVISRPLQHGSIGDHQRHFDNTDQKGEKGNTQESELQRRRPVFVFPPVIPQCYRHF